MRANAQWESVPAQQAGIEAGPRCLVICSRLQCYAIYCYVFKSQCQLHSWGPLGCRGKGCPTLTAGRLLVGDGNSVIYKKNSAAAMIHSGRM